MRLLAKNWTKYNEKLLNLFILEFQNYEDEFASEFSESFHQLRKVMDEHNWLSNYQSLDGLDFACKGLSNRISFDNELHRGVSVFLKYESQIEKVFFQYMQEAVIKFKIKLKD